jgi:hypothetical protein
LAGACSEMQTICAAETATTEEEEECMAFMTVMAFVAIAPMAELEGMVIDAALGCVDDDSAQTKCMDSTPPSPLWEG